LKKKQFPSKSTKKPKYPIKNLDFTSWSTCINFKCQMCIMIEKITNDFKILLKNDMNIHLISFNSTSKKKPKMARYPILNIKNLDLKSWSSCINLKCQMYIMIEKEWLMILKGLLKMI